MRMPATFRPSTRTSLGHLTVAARPVAARMASTRATLAAMFRARSRSRVGRSTMERERFCPGCETHSRLKRPRPRVCCSARTTAPSGAPRSAARRAASMVLARERWQRTRTPTTAVARPRLTSRAARALGVMSERASAGYRPLIAPFDGLRGNGPHPSLPPRAGEGAFCEALWRRGRWACKPSSVPVRHEFTPQGASSLWANGRWPSL